MNLQSFGEIQDALLQLSCNLYPELSNKYASNAVVE
jgi:hypothetical protein